jgi:PhnB protein
VSPDPSSPRCLIPHLIVRGGTEAIAFYRGALGADLACDLTLADGRLGHAELTIGDASFMLADDFPEQDCLGPVQRGGSSVGLCLYVPDVDAAAERAVAAGATLERPVSDEFCGDRVARLRDPFGHQWTLHQRIEEVSPEETRRRLDAR